ncbi:TonB-dependent receptor domain-containing protein [Xylanibacter muris]|uniref:TonB-dependent receptor n=1 Tax=Xylanibacter muris TaxID=2736290 RepID=A0ABX2APE0_9BACT|nr:TonB-dependent receptor [Xylanibacter muris]
MFKIRFSAVLPFLIAAMPAVAQKSGSFTVKGTLVDSLTREAEPYATIKIEKKGNAGGKPLKMMVTDEKGNFRQSVSGTGEMRMTVSMVGRKNIVREFIVKPGQKVVDMDTIYAVSAENELGQVVIRGQKPLVKADIDKITYNISDDPDAKSNTVLEMLRKVPMVTVDGEDNIKVNGNSSFKVYVNGKPNSMMSDNPTEVLKSLPANSVKHIEVITNPGPKYDAEGVGGIINIVTVGGGLEGYTLTLRADADNRGAGTGFFGTVKSGNLTVSAQYSYKHDTNSDNYYGGSRKTVGNISPTSSDQDYSGGSGGFGNRHYGNMEASYDIDTLRLISASFGLWGNNGRNNGYGRMSATSPADGSLLYDYIHSNRGGNSYFSVNGGIDYQRLFRMKDRMFTLSYRISSRPNSSDSYSVYDEVTAVEGWQDFVGRMKDQHNDNSQHSTEHTVQADYTTPIGKIHTLETGVKYIMRDNSSENDRYQRQAAGGAEYEYDPDHSSHYSHRNDILSAYAGYGLKMKKISGRLGLRYEHTFQDVEYRLGRGLDFSKNFDDIIPSLSIGYKITDTQNMRIGYNMRIYRPGIWYLNPYLDDSNPTYINQGNPDLDTEKTHSVNMNYSNFTQKINFNIMLSYSFTDNSIESVTELVSDMSLADKGLQNPTGKDVIYSTYRNIGKSDNVNVSGYVNWNVTPDTRIYANLYGRYSHLEDGTGLSNSGWYVSAYGGAQQSLPHDWRMSMNIYSSSPWISLQGKGSGYCSYTLNVSKSMMKKRLTVSAYASNFLKKYNRSENTLADLNFTSESWSKYVQQRFGVSVNWRFGELKASVRKASRTIVNDDTKDGGSGNG